MRDWTRGTISTRSLKRTRSTLLLWVVVVEEWAREDWVGDELASPESHDFRSWPKLLELSCDCRKFCASYILFFSNLSSFSKIKFEKLSNRESRTGEEREREWHSRGLCFQNHFFFRQSIFQRILILPKCPYHLIGDSKSQNAPCMRKNI